MAQCNEPIPKSEELDSKVWSKTPLDVFKLIIEEADKAKLAIWARTGCAFYHVSSPLLWKWIYIDKDDLQTC